MPIIDITLYNDAIKLYVFSNGSTKQCRIIPFDKKYKNDMKVLFLNWAQQNSKILKSPGYDCTINYINEPHPYDIHQLDPTL